MLGIDHTISKTDSIGKLAETNSVQSIDTVSVISINDATIITADNVVVPSSEHATIIALNEKNIEQADEEAREDARRLGLPTPVELMSQGFGQPSRDHSFTQEASGETVIFQFIKVGTV